MSLKFNYCLEALIVLSVTMYINDCSGAHAPKNHKHSKRDDGTWVQPDKPLLLGGTRPPMSNERAPIEMQPPPEEPPIPPKMPVPPPPAMDSPHEFSQNVNSNPYSNGMGTEPGVPTFEGYNLNEVEIALAKTLYLMIKPRLKLAVDRKLNELVRGYMLRVQPGRGHGRGPEPDWRPQGPMDNRRPPVQAPQRQQITITQAPEMYFQNKNPGLKMNQQNRFPNRNNGPGNGNDNAYGPGRDQMRPNRYGPNNDNGNSFNNNNGRQRFPQQNRFPNNGPNDRQGPRRRPFNTMK